MCRCAVWFIVGTFLLTGVAAAAGFKLGEIQPGEYNLAPITNHLPFSFKDSKDYPKFLQKVELEIGKQDQFRDLPELGSKRPYTGVIALGDKPQKFGVIIDILPEDKRLYVDTDGDGSFAGEPWVSLMAEWYGDYSWAAAHAYFIISPEPIRLKVSYDSKPAQSEALEISVSGLLSQPSPFYKETPYLWVEVRTWFLAELIEDGFAKLAAIVDRNNNGKYNDPEDGLFIDYDDDGYFSQREVIPRKKGIKIRSGKTKYRIDWGAYPEKLLIGGNE